MSAASRSKSAAVKEARLYPVLNGLDELDKIAESLHEHGVVVIPDVFTPDECNKWMKGVVDRIQTLVTHDPRDKGRRVLDTSTPEKICKSWINIHLPPQTRHGLFQRHLSHLQPLWEIRRDKRVYDIFKAAHVGLETFRKDHCKVYGSRIQERPEFVCSMDGINIQPNKLADAVKKQELGEDWAHLDQTIRDNPYLCVQGQVVLTETDASFRCTPGSHKKFEAVLDRCGVKANDKSNWCIFKKKVGAPKNESNEKQLADTIEEMFTKDNYQIPIHAKRGSVILWLSTTIHSAMYAREVKPVNKEDPWLGWRGVAYVCLRPREQFSDKDMILLRQCIEENSGTTHWATKKTDKWRWGVNQSAHSIQVIHKDPKKVYDILKWRPSHDYFIINGDPAPNPADAAVQSARGSSKRKSTADPSPTETRAKKQNTSQKTLSHFF